MKGKVLRKTLAAVMALVIVGGAMPLTDSGLLPFTPLTASAAGGSDYVWQYEQGYWLLDNDNFQFDFRSSTLYIRGDLSQENKNEEFLNYRLNVASRYKILSVYIMEGTVLPEDCSELFSGLFDIWSINIENADTSKVTNMEEMFRNCNSLKTLDLLNFNTSSVTNMNGMFRGCLELEALNNINFDTSNVTDMGYMFSQCRSMTDIDVSDFDTSKVTNMDSMFNYCDSLTTLDLSSFDTSNVTDMGYMFRDSNKLNTVYVSSLWKTNAEGHEMFWGCSSLVGGTGTKWTINHVDGDYAHVDGGANNPGYFTYKQVDNSYFDSSTGTLMLSGRIVKDNIETNFIRNSSLNAQIKYIAADSTAVLPADCTYLFSGLNALESIDFSNIDSSKVKSIRGMFYKCKSLKMVDLRGFDSGRITDMRSAFTQCEKLEYIMVADDFTFFGDPSASIQSDSMFYGCTSLVGGNDTAYNSSVTNNAYARLDKPGQKGYFSMHCTTIDSYGNLILKGYINRYELNSYRGSGKGVNSIVISDQSARLPTDCSGLFKDFPDARMIVINGANNAGSVTNKVTNMSEMFSGCTNAGYIAMIDCDTSSVTDMSDMFYNCKAMTGLDISSLDTGNVTDMSGMFSSCKQLTKLDLSSFDTRNVTNMAMMFSGCAALKTITVGDLWSLESERNSTNMFRGCTSLVGCAGTAFNSANPTNSSYANIDTPETAGYLSVAPTSFALKHNCEFNNNIAMYYAYPKADLTGCDNIRLLVYKEEYEAGAASPTTKKKILKNYSATTINSVDYIMFSFAGITATDMNCKLSATLFYDKNGSTHCSQLDKFSIKEYAHNRLEKSNSAKFKKMILDMLNYGAAAQKYFDKNANDLTNKDLTDAQRKLGTQTMPTLKTCEKTNALSGAKATFNGKNLIFDNNIILVFRMKFPTSYTMKNVKLKLNYKTSKGVSVTKEIPSSKFKKDGDFYTANFDTLAITDFRSPISIKIYDGTKQISSELIYSVETYVYNRLINSTDENYKVLIKELMKYGISAEQNFS